MSVLSLTPAQQDPLSAYRGIRPVDPPRSHASGPAPYRVLAVGGRLLAGHGVLTHDLALSGAIARALSRVVGHGFDVDAVLLERPTVASAARALRGTDLSRTDALVLFLDHGDDLATTTAAVGRVHRLVDDLWHRLTPGASITVVVPPASTTSRTEGELQALTDALRAEAAPLTRIVRLRDRPGTGGPAGQYTVWGDVVAAVVAQSLTDPLVWFSALDELDERKRSAAVRRLGPLDAAWETTFDRVVSFARDAYGARCASLSIIDGDRTRYFTRRGFDETDVAREQTICDLALRTHGGVIVGDAQADDRFKDLPLVRSGAVRFYAGYRVLDPEGQPVGTLCVFDPEPRPVLSQDLALLRDFAITAERRIWELAQQPTSR